MTDSKTATEAAVLRLRRRAHVHTDRCYGQRVFDCAEHHAHDASCFVSHRHCHQAEEPDLVVLLLALDRLTADLEAARKTATEHFRWARDLMRQLHEE